MLLSVCYGFGLFLLGVIAYSAVYHTIHLRLFLVCAMFYVCRCALYIGNSVLGIFPPKFANDWGLFWVEHHLLGNTLAPAADSFAIQGLLIAPLYSIAPEPIFLALAANTAAFSIAGYAVGRFAFLLAPPRKAALVFLAYNLFPAANNFIMFGLRDPIILAGSTIFFLGLGRYLVGQSRSAFNGEVLIGLVVMIVSRPELAVIFVPSIGLIGMTVAANKYKGAGMKRIKPALYLVAIMLLIPASYISYRAAVSDIGFEDAGIATVVGVYGEARYERQFSDKDQSGDQSPIIPPELYAQLPIPARLTIQTAGILILPFPWLINKIPKALAFIDSLIYLLLLWHLWRARDVREVKFGLLVFAVALIGLGTTINNFGNAFRMRIVLYPILITAVTFAVARARRQSA